MPVISSSLGSAPAVAVGIDLGRCNARIATFDENLNHPVLAYNSDGHHMTRVVLEDENHNPVNVTKDNLHTFLKEKLWQLASDAAHTKDLQIVTSIPNDTNDDSSQEWLSVLQRFGGVITEAAAVCLAYGVMEEPWSSRSVGCQRKHVLVLDGGFSGIKATTILLASNSNDNTPLLMEVGCKALPEVNGSTLIEPLAQAVAQQFEQKYRYPRGEVWQSKKARRKLLKECEAGLTTLQINNSSVTIHVDGLYEGMDCQVSISKPKWEHLSSKLVQHTKTFLKTNFVDNVSRQIDEVLLSGNLHAWLKPLALSVFGVDKVVLNPSIDPSGAIAIGCAKQAYLNLQDESSSSSHTKKVPMSPISLGIQTQGDDDKIILIDRGTPLPAMMTHKVSSSLTSSTIDLWQLEPSEKQLCQIELDEASTTTTVRLYLTPKGQLRVWVNDDESIVIG